MNLHSPAIAIAGSATLHPQPNECKTLTREVGVLLARQDATLVVGVENDQMPAA
jgi:hypothetical protein